MQTNQNGGIGRLEKGNDTLILRTEGKYSDLEAIKNTVVKSTQNKVAQIIAEFYRCNGFKKYNACCNDFFLLILQYFTCKK